MKQTDLPEKNRGFLGIFSIPLLRTCYRRNRTDVPEEAQRTTERKLEEKANTGKGKIGVLWLPLELRHCLCVRVCRGQGMGVAERKRKGSLQGWEEEEMNAATCCHGNQLIYCWDVFLALIGSINTSGMRGISTLVQFLQLISALSGIQRHHIVKTCFRKI